MAATVISASTRILGSVEVMGGGTGAPSSDGHGDLVVEGIVEGDVRASGCLTLGRHAQVQGAISAHDVRIAGRLERDVQATGIIHLTATAEVRGDLDAARVVIDDGAIFEGQVRLRREARATRVPRPAPPASEPVTRSVPTVATQTSPREVPTLAYPGRRRVQRRST
jgi:cytoskeletal protein CcmA (bactofilin family)